MAYTSNGLGVSVQFRTSLGEIAMGIQEILESKREEILKIAARHGARNVRVFGSVARGEASADSDVDFLVDVGPQHSTFFPGGLVADLEHLLGRRVDVVEPEALHWYIRDRVLSEATPL
jgi:predicted nucleotidyltransferase